jgi:transposase-like protein
LEGLPEPTDGNDLSITEAAKHLGVPAVALRRWLGYFTQDPNSTANGNPPRTEKHANLFLPVTGLESQEKLQTLDNQERRGRAMSPSSTQCHASNIQSDSPSLSLPLGG